MDDVVINTDFRGLRLLSRGKVRDNYDLGERILMVTTDRISAFDSVMPNGIPNKGRVLNMLSVYWFNHTRDIVKNHLVTADVREYPKELKAHEKVLEGRSMLVQKCTPLPVECVVRGYLSGSGWKEYKKTGSICGEKIPSGLRESDRLKEPIFTPTTKAEAGHDQSITFDEVVKILGRKTAEKIRDYAIRIYEKASCHVEQKGIIIADTKFEFAEKDGEIILIDEALTPDSSRFWPKGSYAPGGPQKSYDKQYVRDYLEGIRWNKEPPAPRLPDDVVKETSRKYEEAYRIITGRGI